MDKLSEEIRKLWDAPVTRQTLAALNNKAQTEKQIIKLENIGTKIFETFEEGGCLDPLTFSLGLVNFYGPCRFDNDAEAQAVLLPEVFEGYQLLQDFDNRERDFVREHVLTPLFESGNAAAIRLALSHSVYEIRHVMIPDYHDMRLKKMHRDLTEDMACLQFALINARFCEGRVWRILPEKLVEGFVRSSEELSELIRNRVLKQWFEKSVAEMREAIRADRLPPPCEPAPLAEIIAVPRASKHYKL